MIWHVLGWVTLCSTFGVAGFSMRALWDAGTRPWTWQRNLRVPKPVEHVELSSGSDYVGAV